MPCILIVPLMGYRSEVVYYARQRRTAGKSKYPLAKMLSTAWEAITSFSIRPLSMILLTGTVIALCAFAALLALTVFAACGRTVSEGKYILASVWFLGGMQLTAIGVVGEYVGRTYFEAKRRPRYRVKRLLRHDPLSAGDSDSDDAGRYEKTGGME